MTPYLFNTVSNHPRWSVKRATGPAVEPITLGEVQDQLRGTDDDDIPYVGSLITVAREYIEGLTGRSLINQVWDQYADGWPYRELFIQLRRGPLVSLASVNYTNSAGVEAAMSTTDYIVDSNDDPTRIVLAYGSAWPGVALLPYPALSIRIRYTAGYAANPQDGTIPTPLRHAMLMIIADKMPMIEVMLKFEKPSSAKPPARAIDDRMTAPPV